MGRLVHAREVEDLGDRRLQLGDEVGVVAERLAASITIGNSDFIAAMSVIGS